MEEVMVLNWKANKIKILRKLAVTKVKVTEMLLRKQIIKITRKKFFKQQLENNVFKV